MDFHITRTSCYHHPQMAQVANNFLECDTLNLHECHGPASYTRVILVESRNNDLANGFMTFQGKKKYMLFLANQWCELWWFRGPDSENSSLNEVIFISAIFNIFLATFAYIEICHLAFVPYDLSGSLFLVMKH